VRFRKTGYRCKINFVPPTINPRLFKKGKMKVKNKGLIMILFVSATCITLASSAFAYTNKELLEDCRSVVRADFDFTKTNTQNDEWDFLMCTGYMIAITHSFNANCHDYQTLDFWKNRDSETKKVFRQFYAANNQDPDATTQAFINWAQDNPDKWETDAPSSTYLWLPTTFPCN